MNDIFFQTNDELDNLRLEDELVFENILFENVSEEICIEALFDFGIEEATYLRIFEVDNNFNSSEIEELNAHQLMSSVSNSVSGCSSYADVYIPSEELNGH